MWPRSSSGMSSQVDHHEASAPASEASPPAAFGKTSLIRWSRSGPSTPKSARSGLASSTRTNDGEIRSTLVAVTSVRIIGSRSAVDRHARVLSVVVAPDGDHQRGAGDGVGDHPAVEVEDAADDVLGHHLRGRSLGDDHAVGHRDQVVGVPRGQVEVVQHHHHGGAAAGVEVGEQVEHLDLVGEVEVRRGLVEEQQVGALRQGHRDPDALPLAAGQLVDDPVAPGRWCR